MTSDCLRIRLGSYELITERAIIHHDYQAILGSYELICSGIVRVNKQTPRLLIANLSRACSICTRIEQVDKQTPRLFIVSDVQAVLESYELITATAIIYRDFQAVLGSCELMNRHRDY